MKLSDYIRSKSVDGAVYMPYLTVGDPSFAATEEFGVEMIDAGADLLELGAPFSDPTADGPVIQAAMVRAMANPGFSIERVLESIQRIHDARPETPLVILSYCNPVLNGFRRGDGRVRLGAGATHSDSELQAALEEFLDRSARAGVRGLVLPDLPFDSPEGEFLREAALNRGIAPILMVAPNTGEDRLKRICAAAEGFIYYVTSLGVTGMRSELPPELKDRVRRVQDLSGLPVLAGFGFSTPEQAGEAARALDGVIVGSLNHRIIAEQGARAGAELARITREFKAAARRPARA